LVARAATIEPPREGGAKHAAGGKSL